MALDSKKIAKNTIILYVRMIVLMLLSFYTSRVILQALGVEDYGLYNVIGGIVSILGFLSNTMATSSARFITVALGSKNLDNQIKTFSTVFWVNFLLAIIVVFFAETLGLWFLINKMVIPETRLTAAIWVYQFSIFTILFSIISVPYNAAIIANERMNAFAYISLFAGFAKLIIALFIQHNKFDRLIIYAMLLSTVELVVLSSNYIYGKQNLKECKVKRLFDKDFFVEMFKFITWSSYGSFASVGYTHGINILLNLFFGPVINAARAISVQIQNAVISLTSNFQMAINPQLMINTSNKDFAASSRLLFYSSKLSVLLLCIIGLPILSETHFVLSVWLKDFPQTTVQFSQIMVIISIWGCLANGLRVINQAEGNIKKFQAYECTILLFIVPASYICLHIWKNPLIVFLIHFVFDCLAQIIRIHIVLPKIGMRYWDYIKEIYFRLFPIFLIPTVLGYIISNILEENLIRFCINLCIIEISIFSCAFLFGLNRVEKEMLKNYIKKSKK